MIGVERTRNGVILVYNDKEGYFYVHHDILMLHMPLCLTWLDYDINSSNPGNMQQTIDQSRTLFFWRF